jgi:hypothetical protein
VAPASRGDAVVVAPNSLIAVALRHTEVDKWLQGGENEMETLQRGVCAHGEEGGEGRTPKASL